MDSDIFSYDHDHRIRKKSEISLLLKKGKRHRGELIEFISLPNGLDHCRLCFFISKKVGKAVQRNKIRRQWKEALTGLDLQGLSAQDLAVRPLKGFLPPPPLERQSILLKVLQKRPR